jgi:PPK2 family polyphosphate:nucleotide phosphotransferase
MAENKLQTQIKHKMKRIRKYSEPYKVDSKEGFKLTDFKTDDNFDMMERSDADEILITSKEAIASSQEMLYADDKQALLVIIQAPDAAGKDGAIKHVMSGINPQGCDVVSFKAPNTKELDRDFLHRIAQHAPERGRIGIFNRSHYEDVLVPRIHPHVLKQQKIPLKLITKDIWEERFKSIKNYESHLHRNGITVLKFFLYISKDEQKKRFIERIDNPSKNWKFDVRDVEERKHYKKYMEAYEDAIRHTATRKSPWYIVPADNKKFARVVIASAIVNTLEGMGLKYPEIPEEQKKLLQKIKRQLEKEK